MLVYQRVSWSDWMFLARSPAKRSEFPFKKRKVNLKNKNPGMRNFANLDAVPAGLRRANGCPILRIPFRPFPQLPFRRLGTSALTPNSAWDLRVAPLTSYVSRHLVARWTGWTLGLDGVFQATDVRRTMPCPALVPQGLSPTEPPSKKKKAWVGDGRGGTLAGFHGSRGISKSYRFFCPCHPGFVARCWASLVHWGEAATGKGWCRYIYLC